MKTQFVFFFWFVSFKSISLGISLNLKPLHVEIHIPFGFIKIGLDERGFKPINHDETKWRGFGFTGKYIDREPLEWKDGGVYQFGVGRVNEN